ncbi:MAG TPA: ArsA family ATPase [Blastocatellia bacterium]|nr:ArsA family ATPase [Blastocatellia bacterium]
MKGAKKPPGSPHRLDGFVPQQPLLLFGGKGGVGKTTAAAATALELHAQCGADGRILLFSTDPAHSLSDCLGTKIGNTIKVIAKNKRGGELFAYEMDAESALKVFKKEYGAALAEIFERGTFLDKEDIGHLMGLSLPGIDEVMCLLELSRLTSEGGYSRIIVDTAPTGHTLRFLQLPRVFSEWLGALDSMSEKHRFMVAQLTGRSTLDRVDRFLDDFTSQIQSLGKVVSDRDKSAFILVTIPESIAYEETERFFRSLKEIPINVSHLIVNRVENGNRACAYCRSRAVAQAPVLRRLATHFKETSIRQTPLVSFPLEGQRALLKFARLIWKDSPAPTTERLRQTPLSADLGMAKNGHVTEPAEFLKQLRKWLIFGGKGGVGKTTASCATALALAESNPSQRIMVFSADPAHSLSDSFGERIGELRTAIAGRSNLDGIEIDPSARFAMIKARLNSFLDAALAPSGGRKGWTLEFDPQAMRGFFAAAPPGIDEIMALTAVGDLLANGRYDTIIVDSAPTGHLLRFLELPEVALSWIRTLMRLLLKYQEVVRLDSFAQELLSLSKSIKSTVSLMTDGSQTEFIGVATPELMSLEETRRLARSLSGLKVPMQRLLINNIIPDLAANSCRICESRRHRQDDIVAKFKRSFSGRSDMYLCPQQPFSIQGPDLLRTHFANWRRLA